MKKLFRAQLDNEEITDVEATTITEAKKKIAGTIIDAKIVSIAEIEPPKPDASYVEQDGGYYFTAWGIHVAASSLAQAKARVLEHHGKDLDNDIPPDAMKVAIAAEEHHRLSGRRFI